MIAIFIFYDFAAGKQARLAFSDTFKHCTLLMYDGETWIFSEMTTTGFLNRTFRGVPEATRLLRRLRIIKEVTCTITCDIPVRKRRMWLPFLVRTCNEHIRYTSGIDIGWSFNPWHLHRKLLQNKRKNYEILDYWRR